jgi:hypothetical protein
MTRTIRRSIALVIVSLLGVTMLTSCGDDEERLSKSEFVKKVNALCKARDKKFEVLDEANFFDMKEGAKVWAKVQPAGQDYVDAVADLEPPEDADELMDEYSGKIQNVVDHIGDVGDLAEAGVRTDYSQGLADLFSEFSTVDDEIDAYGANDCDDEEDSFPVSEEPAAGATAVDVGAKEYEFDVPDDIEAGKLAIRLTNTGEELHLLAISKLKDGVTFEQLQAAIAANPNDDPGLTEDAGISPVVGPKKPVTFNTELAAGTYVAICFLPTPDGTPHLAKGMMTEFAVS